MVARFAERRALAISGPTAIGKTALAMALAQRLPVDLISVDSAMVYRQMDIGTAKPSAVELALAPHALIDLVDPSEAYSTARFLHDAGDVVADSFARGRIPVFVGGTMMYFNALREGLADLPAADAEVRAALAAELAARGGSALHAELARVDPAAAQRIEPANRQRLLRALEVYRISGKPISAYWGEQRPMLQSHGAELLEVTLVPRDRAALYARIDRRFGAMLEQGLLGEVETLYARGDLSLELPSMRSVGYRQLWQHLAGELSLDAAAAQACQATRRLAKRQLTWQRSWTDLCRLHCDDGIETQDAVLRLLRSG
ncbi:MAG: tRNA (adenosine(37)-N6)-dimethylallyltransferase MiaA [Pseudomonadota bacterium]